MPADDGFDCSHSLSSHIGNIDSLMNNNMHLYSAQLHRICSRALDRINDSHTLTLVLKLFARQITINDIKCRSDRENDVRV